MTSPNIAELVTRAADFVRSEGRDGAADTLVAKRDAPGRPRPVILVAGEDKRGKSSLVNALLEKPDLSPVGVEVVTGSPISFFYADPPTAAIVRYGETSRVPVDFEEGRNLATVEGNPQNQANIRAVQLGTPAPILQRVMIVDTPGVGGLSSGHAELTLQSMQFADALMFVLESGAQIRAAELEFLRRASARIDTVVFALTKIDLHRGWRNIMEDNRRILREQAPRFADCPMVPVSALLANRALASEDEDDRRELLEESGIPALQEAISDFVVERAGVLNDANLLRETLGPLAVAERALSEQLSALESGGETRATLEQEQARLQKLGQDKAEWPRQFDSEIRKLTLRRSEDVARGITDIRRKYDERLKKATKKDEESLPGEVVADLTALASRLNEDAAATLVAMVEKVIDDIDSASDLKESIAHVTANRLGEDLSGINMGTHTLNGYDKLSVLSSFSSGRSLSSLLTGSSLGIGAGIVAPPVGIAIGIGLGALYAFQAFKGKARAAFTSEFRSWLSEQCNETQVTVNTTFQRELIDLQEEMRTAVRDALAEREKQLSESLEVTKRLLEEEGSKREAAQEQLVQRRNNGRQIQQEISALLTELRSNDGGEPQPRPVAGAPVEPSPVAVAPA